MINLKRLYLSCKSKSLLQTWVMACSAQEIANLLSALRGSDKDNGKDKDAKNITKMIRHLVGITFNKKSKYSSNIVIPRHLVITKLVSEFKDNKHWVEHILYASTVIGNRHPNPYTRSYWNKLHGEVRGKVKKLSQKNHPIKINEKVKEL